ncbi:MAG: aminoglycoside phosphotransferase family protein [Planctomycetes bacterium]|nr:aminoglycoside phosphotransferase family protein [Planctomycetota bacterium]
MDREVYFGLQRDPAAWRSMVVEACAAAGVPGGEVRAFGDCANLVAAVGAHVVKLFPPFHRHQWQSERVGLRHFAGRLPVRVPQRIADGERDDGWCWVVQELVPGAPLEQRWAAAAHPERARLLEQIGALMRAAHALPVGEAAALAPEWGAFLLGQRNACVARHHRLGAPAWLLRDIPRLLDEWAPRLAADPRRVVLTGEYTPFNLLVGDDVGLRLQSMIDFGDTMVGAPEYDLLGPSLFLCGGDAELVAALLRGYHGADLPMTQELRMRLMALAVMHRYANFELQVRIDRWWDRARSLEQLAELIWPA